jgi:hypothetical protein
MVGIRPLLLVVAAGALVSCNSQPPVGTVKVSMTLGEATAVLDTAGARDISGTVSIVSGKTDPDTVVRDVWYLLPDGTCLHLVAEGRLGQDTPNLVIKFLTLGKVGQGYGSKMEWVEQEKINPKFVNLADHRS